MSRFWIRDFPFTSSSKFSFQLRFFFKYFESSMIHTIT